MFGFDQVHEYVLKLVDVAKCPEMDENCPEADKLDITKCFSGKHTNEYLTIESFSILISSSSGNSRGNTLSNKTTYVRT